MFSSDLLSAVIRTSPLVIGRHPFLIYGGQVGPHALLPVEGPSWMANHTAGHVPFSWPFNKWRRFLLQFNRLRKLTLLFLLLWEGQPGVWKKDEVVYSRNCLHLVFQPGDGEQEDPPLFLPGNKTVVVVITIIINQILIWQSQQNVAASACGDNQWPT